MTVSSYKDISPFNTALETGVRSLAVLVAAYPALFDLQRLVEMDYIVVHSDDVEGGPKSLHAPLPMRAGELLVRRELVDKGLQLMISRGLVQKIPMESGFHYVAGEEAAPFLTILASQYSKDLIHRARWAAEKFQGIATDDIHQWSSQFVLNHRGNSDL